MWERDPVYPDFVAEADLSLLRPTIPTLHSDQTSGQENTFIADHFVSCQETSQIVPKLPIFQI